MNSRIVRVGLSTLACLSALVAITLANDDREAAPFAHVLLLSIDGLHAVDLDRYVTENPASTLAQLSATGHTYTHASATMPSDSFPGTLAMVTGGTPRSTGVYYDDGWDRTLAAASGACTPGTRVRWKQNLDLTPVSFPSFAAFVAFWTAPVTAALDPSKLPRDPTVVPPAIVGCTTSVYPHQFPRVNNVFQLIKSAGGRTAWADKHPAYEFLNGPTDPNADGYTPGVDDLYTPEIATSITPAPPLPLTAVITDSFSMTRDYDDLKVAAILNEIKGFDHSGMTYVGVPTLFGMNFQAVSVGQKLDMSPAGGAKGGYVDANGTPSAPLQQALDHTDASIGRMVSALADQGLLDSTVIIISAKHGNSPMDQTTLVRVNAAAITTIINSVAPNLQAQLSADTGPLIWLTDQTKTTDVIGALSANRAALNLWPDDPATARDEGILSGADLAALWADPLSDSRAPDIVLLPKPGTLYATGLTKIADHGSFNEDDVHVGLLVSNRWLSRKTIGDSVETRQIACTILKSLGITCRLLASQSVEPSRFLPHSNHKKRWSSDAPFDDNDNSDDDDAVAHHWDHWGHRDR